MWKPEFLREIEDRSSEAGIAEATREMLANANIEVEAHGDMDAIAGHSGGLLFIGDHKHRWEFLGLMSVMAEMGRHNTLHIAKFYVQRQIRQVLGQAAASAVLPVYPRLLASDRPRRQQLNSELLNRVVYRQSLLTAEESSQANRQAVRTASGHLAAAGELNIYPCGRIRDWQRYPWREGVGRIIAGIPDEDKKTTMVVPYGTSDIARVRLPVAMATRGRINAGCPQPFTMHFGPVRSAAEIVDTLAVEERDDPKRITDSLRQWALAEKQTD